MLEPEKFKPKTVPTFADNDNGNFNFCLYYHLYL